MGFLSPPEGFNSWDEYDRFRKETGPSLRKSFLLSLFLKTQNVLFGTL